MAVSRFPTHAGVGHPLVSATPERFDLDSCFAYVKGLMVPWLMATGLAPDAAWDLARHVEDHIAGSDGDRVSLDELRVLARAVLGEAEGDETAERFRRWHDFATLGRPLVVLIGGVGARVLHARRDPRGLPAAAARRARQAGGARRAPASARPQMERERMTAAAIAIRAHPIGAPAWRRCAGPPRSVAWPVLAKGGTRWYRERDLRAEVERRFRRPVIAVEPRPAAAPTSD